MGRSGRVARRRPLRMTPPLPAGRRRPVLAGVALAAWWTVAGGAQPRSQPPPDLYHWVLPVHASGVDVARLHPNDCYAVQRADGSAYVGPLTPGLGERQRQLAPPYAHLVETVGEHPDCLLTACQRVEAIAAAITREVTRISGERMLRRVDHRPSPFDRWVGGAYTDVGSDDRHRFRNQPEQRMVHRHLSTSARGNCYEAKIPRTLSIHVRDQERNRERAGVYSGYLYVEHHHSRIAGDSVAGG